ncbi:UNVERIFIED_CONTAM: hypothetical protein K2H54_044702 [Gekko kuhli]
MDLGPQSKVSRCQPNEHNCLGTEHCIPMTELCNGENDCVDGSDEGVHCRGEAGDRIPDDSWAAQMNSSGQCCELGLRGLDPGNRESKADFPGLPLKCGVVISPDFLSVAPLHRGVP